jgi:hypothetical protein
MNKQFEAWSNYHTTFTELDVREIKLPQSAGLQIVLLSE